MPRLCKKHPNSPRYIKGKTNRCLACGRESARNWADLNRERHLENSRRHHKLTKEKVALRKRAYYKDHPDKAEQYKEASIKASYRKYREASVYTKPHNGICQVCKKEKLLIYDHDHKTGAFRGWICNNCNLGLGHFKDDPYIFTNAIEYLTSQT